MARTSRHGACVEPPSGRVADGDGSRFARAEVGQRLVLAAGGQADDGTARALR